jgi:2-oxoisovalerate dehydrogenase E2 component (dihydrolipoyl transacylase)
MSTIIVMPQLGESVAEGIIGKWLKNEGDQIEKDEPIVEIITDKVNAEIPSPVSGVLSKITQPEGATVGVGQEIAVIGDGSDTQQPEQSESAALHASQPAPAGAPGGNGQNPRGVAEAAGEAATPIGVPPHFSGIANLRGERVRSSPLVRRLAEQYSINLSEVAGTGIGGRVSKHDILSYVEEKQRVQAAPATAARADESGPYPSGRYETVPETPMPAGGPLPAAPRPEDVRPTFTVTARREAGANEESIPVPPLRKMIADRMVLSVSSIPHATTNSEVDMTNVVRYRELRKDGFREREGVPLSYVAFVIKATVEALKEFPMVNAEWAGDTIILKRDVNINVAVDAPEGLTTPVIHHADEKSLSGLSKAIYDLAIRARDKKLRIEDMQGGTFTVNNTGALGSVGGVSIINYPQAGILAAATIVKRARVVEQDGQDVIAIRSMMNVSFSFDHRLLDGGYAAGFVNTVKRKLEAWPADYPLY